MLMKKLRLIVIEDNRLLRDGLTAMLNGQPDIKVVAAFGTAEKALHDLAALKLNVVLLDLGLRGQNSLNVVRMIRKKSKEIAIIVMDLIPTQADIIMYVEAGVAGFILKDATVEEFIRTIRSVALGSKVLPTNLTDSLFTQSVEYAVRGSGASVVANSVRMTRREHQVVQLIAEGMTNKEIAQRLHLSTYTVKSHVHNILEKLTLHTRVQIARYAHDAESFNTLVGSISQLNT